MSLLMNALKKAEQDKQSTSDLLSSDTKSMHVSVENEQHQQASRSISDNLALSTTETPIEKKPLNEMISAADLARDLNDRGLTPVAAETNFVIDTNRLKTNTLAWSMLIGVTLLLAFSLVFYVFNYVLPSAHFIHPSLTQHNTAEPSVTMQVVEQAWLQAAAKSKRTHSLLHKPAVHQAVKDIDPNQTEYAQVDDSSVNNQASLADEIVLPPAIQITRYDAKSEISTLLTNAYTQYLANDYVSAEKTYQQVLQILPNNRHALLGLAIIADNSGRIDQAYTRYLQLLQYYPADNTVAALINLQAKGDLNHKSTVLKELLQRQPDNAFFYYSLGQLYATHNRWSEAQEAFFHAYIKADSNPNYAYNLAVSFEHINQPQLALDYYALALDMADRSVVNFDTATVDSHITRLSSLDNIE